MHRSVQDQQHQHGRGVDLPEAVLLIDHSGGSSLLGSGGNSRRLVLPVPNGR